MKEKLSDLIPWVEKLEATLVKTNIDDDHEEVERRARLARSALRSSPPAPTGLTSYDRDLEDIGKRSLALSEKGKVARALDKKRDSGEVIKLIEKLRQAILVYQVSARLYLSPKPLTCGTGVTATGDIQPGHPTDRMSLPLIFHFEANLLSGWFQSSFDAILKLHQVREHARN